MASLTQLLEKSIDKHLLDVEIEHPGASEPLQGEVLAREISSQLVDYYEKKLYQEKDAKQAKFLMALCLQLKEDLGVS